MNKKELINNMILASITLVIVLVIGWIVCFKFIIEYLSQFTLMALSDLWFISSLLFLGGLTVIVKILLSEKQKNNEVRR
jgi:hypothetical protein